MRWQVFLLLTILLLSITPALAEENVTEITPTIDVSQGETLWQYFKDDYIPKVFDRLKDLLKAPAENPDMIWIITPLIITLMVMTFYFGKYMKEELGWNTAVGNSLVLFYTSIDLLRYIYNGVGIAGGFAAFNNFAIDPVKTVIAVAVACFGIILLFSNFIHALPKKVAFFLSSPLPINLTAYIAIAITYANVAFDWITISAALVMFLILYFGITIIKFLEGHFFDAIAEAKEKEEQDEKVKKRLAELSAEDAPEAHIE